MQSKMIALTTAAVIGAATLAAATSANAGQWVYVPDGEGYAPQTRVYESGRTYVTEPDIYVPAPAQRRVYRQAAPSTSSDLYVQTVTPIDDGCTYHRERGLFGGWHEVRDCP